MRKLVFFGKKNLSTPTIFDNKKSIFIIYKPGMIGFLTFRYTKFFNRFFALQDTLLFTIFIERLSETKEFRSAIFWKYFMLKI